MKGLHGWMRSLENSEAAVLSTLLKELDRVTGSDESSGIELADVILKDPGLTANIIRVANTVRFNPSNISITTVSRAIINIGFRNIRSICLSIKVLESVLKESPSPLLISMLARALHGANQSKALCPELTSTQQEEVYVACLLSHLAELLVLGCNEQEVRLLKNEIKAHTDSEDKDRCAERLLGVSFKRLAKTLMKQWRIEGLVNDVLDQSEESSKTVQAVLLGDEISRTSILGWDSPEFQETVAKVAEFKDVSVAEAKKELINIADEAAETIATFGKKTIYDQVPTSKKGPIVDQTKVEVSDLLRPDLNVELKSADDLASEESLEKPNINKVFKLALEGINNGVGLERVAIAIFEKDHLNISVKYMSGEKTADWRKKFSVKYERSRAGFLYNLFERDQAVWVGNADYKHISQYVTPEYKGITGQGRFFIAPLKSGSRKIGFVYADMGVSERDLELHYFEGFHKFYTYVRNSLEKLNS